jgi:hypothetical protein
MEIQKDKVEFIKNQKNLFREIADKFPMKCLTFSPNWFLP